MTTIQCTVCKNQDELSNLVIIKLPKNKSGYVHSLCIEKHILRGLDASTIADEIFDHDFDATNEYEVKEFLRRERLKILLGGRCPTVDEIVAAAYKREATSEKIGALADFIEQLRNTIHFAMFAPLPDDEWKPLHFQLFAVLQRARQRLVMYLVYTGDMLVGTEYCNECDEVDGTVVRIEREPDLLIITDSSRIYPQDICCDCYFRLPGSNAYNEFALVEIARARTAATQ